MLSINVEQAISMLNEKINRFNSKMLTIVTKEYNEVQERIYQVVEATLRDSQSYIQEYMHSQERQFAMELLEAKQQLMEQVSYIESMRIDINKPYWQNMAGVFINNDFENNINIIIKKCEGA